MKQGTSGHDASIAVRCGIGVLLVALGAGFSRGDDEFPPFPKELLDKPEYIEAGKGVFEQICKFCHGKAAYPGKAPKLNPQRYTPEFVYDRVSNGFRGMPGWKAQYSEQELQGVTVYIMSKEFHN